MRTPCGRFIGIRTYSLSWAPTFRGCLALAFCTLIVSHSKGFVKRFFTFFSREVLGSSPRSLLLTPLLYHNLGDLSRVFYIFFQGWFARPLRPEDATLLRPLPLTMIVYHKPYQKSTGNVAQIREKMRPEVCAKCELIFFEQCDIIEILRAASVGAQPKKATPCGVAHIFYSAHQTS